MFRLLQTGPTCIPLAQADFEVSLHTEQLFQVEKIVSHPSLVSDKQQDSKTTTKNSIEQYLTFAEEHLSV